MSVLAWVMAVGLVLDVLFIVVTRTPVVLDRPTLGWMAVAGFGNAFGLLLLLRSRERASTPPGSSATTSPWPGSCCRRASSVSSSSPCRWP